MSEGRDNGGILFPNTRKQTDRSPDYTGEITVDGRPMELSAWRRKGRTGEYLTLAVRPRRQERRPPSPAEVARAEEQRRRTWHP